MRSHVGFDTLWSMKIPVPYALLLRDGAFGWSCGQCPLDRSGAVVAPDDPVAQAALVTEYCAQVLAQAGFAPQDLVMALVYHDVADPAPSLLCLQKGLGKAALLVPVRVPAFYYPGMRIEVDLFAVADGPHPAQPFARNGLVGHEVTAGGITYLAATLISGHDTGTARAALPDTLIIEHWASPNPLPGLPAHTLIDRDLPDTLVWAVSAEPDHAGAGKWLSLTGTAPDQPGLVAQTEAIMQAHADALHAAGLRFADVVKSTTHYIGEPTAHDLHANMQVRNRRYIGPDSGLNGGIGPASTGIRVAGLANPGALTAISLLIRAPARSDSPATLHSVGKTL